jgi:thioredoxin reductase (NADPH)
MHSLETYDVVILGTGPAGLQAAIHAARKKVSVLVLGKQTKSSAYHAHIENFCCVFNVSGEEILDVGRQQASSFGAVFLEEDVLQITQQNNGFQIHTENQRKLACRTLIVATGTQRNKLGVKGEKALLGKGVSYCVDCDGHFYKNEEVALIGGESAAADGAITLSRIAAKVHLVCEKLNLASALEQALSRSPVQVHESTKVEAILGETKVEGLQLSDGTVLPVSGVFIEQGAKGLMELATNLGIRLDDEMRYILTDKQQATNIPGIFAAGDICGPPWQVAKAVGEGCVAGINAANYAKKGPSS